MRTLARLIAALLVFMLPFLGAFARGQEPDQRGEVTLDRPVYQHTRANAPIPPKYHIRNEGGSDGQGLCVISSVIINGAYQGVHGLAGLKESRLWRTAKSRPGGYSPDKLQRLLDEVHPDEKWASYVGRDPSVLEKLSSMGYPIGATMNTGALYRYWPIHHMISLVHYKRDGLACVVDNNDPGKYHWMPAREYDRRWIDGGTGWAFIWTRLPLTANPAVWLAVPLGIMFLAVLVAGVGYARRSTIEPE